MLRWTGTSASADIVECHFCTQKSRLQSHKGKAAIRDHLPIISGSTYHFLCPYCESWNVKNPSTGEFIDNVQSVHHETSPAVTALRKKRASGISETPFCHNCTTNQQLQVQLIAGYLPLETTSSEDDELLARLPRYKESLDARYPVVCPNCQGRVDDIIQERNLKAKARTIGGWLKNSARLARDTASSAVQLETDATYHSRLWLWHLKGTCWKTLYAITALGTFIQPQIARYADYMKSDVDSILFQTFQKLPWRVLLPIITLFFSFWDPTYRDRVLRDGRVDIKGKRTWFTLQALCYLARLALVCGWQRDLHHSETLLFAISFLHIIMLLGHRKIIRTQGLKRIKLLERNGQTSSSAVSPSSTPFRQRSSAILNQEKLSPHQGQVKMVSSALPAFGKVSMGSTPPVSRMYKRHALANEDYDDDDMDEDADPADTTAAPMDWQPFDEDLHVSRTDVPDVDMQDDTINKRAEIKLRPAVFNPEDEWHLAAYGMKGLDGLFAKGVTLDDVRMDDAASHTSKVNPFTHLVAAALASVLCGTIFWLYNSPRVAVNGSLFTSNSDAWSWPFKRAAR